MAGDRRDFAYVRALRQASEDGDFRHVLEFAQKRYLEDISPERPNEALKESWPSSCMFRSILYRAGKKLGERAVAYLDWIPDADQRLFAAEKAAAYGAIAPERLADAFRAVELTDDDRMALASAAAPLMRLAADR